MQAKSNHLKLEKNSVVSKQLSSEFNIPKRDGNFEGSNNMADSLVSQEARVNEIFIEQNTSQGNSKLESQEVTKRTKSSGRHIDKSLFIDVKNKRGVIVNSQRSLSQIKSGSKLISLKDQNKLP